MKVNNKLAAKILIILVLIFILIIATAPKGASGPKAPATVTKAAPAPKAVYTATVDDTTVEDPATVNVDYTVTNTGTGSGYPTCSVQAKNANGSYYGESVRVLKDTPLTAPLAPKASVSVGQNVTVTHNGAAFADQVTVTCDEY